MDRLPQDTDAYNDAAIAETRAQFSILTRAALNREQPATKRICDAVCEYLADDNALAQLVSDTLARGDAFQKVLTDVIWAEACDRAEKELAERAIANRQEAIEDRAGRRVFDTLFPCGVC